MQANHSVLCIPRYLGSFTVNSDSVESFISAASANATADLTTQGRGMDLHKRPFWDTSKIYVQQYSTGSYHTLASKSKIQAIVRTAIAHRFTYDEHISAYYTLLNSGSLIGHLKGLDMYSDGCHMLMGT